MSKEKVVVVYVTTNELPDEANKYMADVTLKGFKDPRKSLAFKIDVISVFKAPLNNSQIMSSPSVAFIPWFTIDAWSEWRDNWKEWFIHFHIIKERSP